MKNCVRMWSLIKWDLKSFGKYGFYALYMVISVIYIVILYALPLQWRKQAAEIMIFSDPAAMGLFFMGAIVLLEKSQRVPCAFAVSPIKPIEYICSKVISLGIISVIVSVILAYFSKTDNLLEVIAGTALSSVIFTLLGMIIATKITSLNQFIVYTVPIEIIGFVPAIIHVITDMDGKLKNYPANVCIDMIAGESVSVCELLIIFALIILLLFAGHKCVLKMWKSMGGAKI